MMIDDDLILRQQEREEQSAQAGYQKFKKNEERNKLIGNASNNTFGIAVIRERHELIVEQITEAITKQNGYRCTQIRDALRSCTRLDKDGNPHELMNIEVWAFLGYQAVIDNVFNTNRSGAKTTGRYGGDRNLVARKNQSELELFVGKLINDQMSLDLIRRTFPNWYRHADKRAQKTEGSSIRSTPRYWKSRMTLAINRFANRLEEKGDIEGAEFLRNRKPWSIDDCRVIGEMVVSAVVTANQDFLKSEWKQEGKKRVYDITLTPFGISKANELFEQMAQYSHDVLPMLIEPIPITNDSLGGWLKDMLQQNEYSRKGDIVLSDRHLEFINRQSRCKFEVNPFTHALIKELVRLELPLGKFDYQVPETAVTAAQHLGIAAVSDPSERQRLLDQMDREQRREARRAATDAKTKNIAQSAHNLISMKLLDRAEKLEADEYFYIPMKYCFRGRIYSRVPFISFQGTDTGKYLIRFHEKTPIDERTLHWLKVGISNAAGNDKKCWEKRIQWFDRNIDEIINVGQMMDGGNFHRAYEFLTQDCIDDPFCLAALANEYYKIYVAKTQDYTQVFVLVDASCSGTSIFNAWRRNKHGALKTNLIDTPEPADVYMEVWHEIKRLAPEKSFRASFIKRLEASKLLRKMMKSTYVPASYASPKGEQLAKLKNFNREVLVPANLGFKEAEMEVLLELWPVALDNVSSIDTVVNWFRERTKEVIKAGATEIVVTSCNGTRMTLKYPKTDLVKTTVLGNTSPNTRRKYLQQVRDETNLKALLSAITANVTHFTDAAALCEALWDFDVPWVGVHDAVGYAPSKTVDEGIERMKRGLITATSHNIWNNFREQNNLPHDHKNAAPVIGDLDLELIMGSNYMFS